MAANKVDLVDLQNKLFSIETALKKAQILQWDLTHNFLGEVNEENKRVRFSLEYEASHYKGLIIEDNLDVIEQVLAEINGMFEASDKVSKVTTHEKEFQSV